MAGACKSDCACGACPPAPHCDIKRTIDGVRAGVFDGDMVGDAVRDQVVESDAVRDGEIDKVAVTEGDNVIVSVSLALALMVAVIEAV